MLYTTLSKLSPQQKYTSSKAYGKTEGLYDLSSMINKNLFSCVNGKIGKKYGRKFLLKQVKQTGQKKQNHHLFKESFEISQIQFKKNKNITPKQTFYWQNRPLSIKRHTHNHHCHTSGREEELDNDIFREKQSGTRLRRCHPPSQAVKSQQSIIHNYFQRKLQHKKWNISYNNTSDFQKRQTKSRKNRINSKHIKIGSIELSENQLEKVSFVNLIKKYQFQNLKTSNSHLSNPQYQVDQKYKYATEFIKTQPLQEKDDIFSDQIRATAPPRQEITSRKQNKTTLTNFRKYEQNNINTVPSKGSTREPNPALTPWATETDTIQTPLE